MDTALDDNNCYCCLISPSMNFTAPMSKNENEEIPNVRLDDFIQLQQEEEIVSDNQEKIDPLLSTDKKVVIPFRV